MIEEIVISYIINRTSANDHVYAEKPANIPDKFLVIEKTGTSTENRITTATVTVKSYGVSMLDAMSLNEEVKEAMDGITILDSVSSCDLNSDYNYTDPSSKQYRYQAVFQIVHY